MTCITSLFRYTFYQLYKTWPKSACNSAIDRGYDTCCDFLLVQLQSSLSPKGPLRRIPFIRYPSSYTAIVCLVAISLQLIPFIKVNWQGRPYLYMSLGTCPCKRTKKIRHKKLVSMHIHWVWKVVHFYIRPSRGNIRQSLWFVSHQISYFGNKVGQGNWLQSLATKLVDNE